MSDMQYNLVLVASWNRAATLPHLGRIAEKINGLGVNVRATAVLHEKRRQLGLIRLWRRPALSLSLQRSVRRKLLPGRYMTGAPLLKHDEYARFDAAGMPVPAWRIITPGLQIDADEWGPYVVEKPSAGMRSALVRIRRTSRIGYVSPESLPADHPGRLGPMLVQKFVYTGRWPVSYRVVTLFGEVVLCFRQTSPRGAALDGRWNFGGGGVNIASNTKDMTIELVDDKAVIDLAEQAHRSAFPELATLAFDIVRDAETGELFILESHPYGHWMFCSERGRQIEAANGVSFEAQFDAIAKSAGILARETPRLAEKRWQFGAA